MERLTTLMSKLSKCLFSGCGIMGVRNLEGYPKVGIKMMRSCCPVHFPKIFKTPDL